MSKHSARALHEATEHRRAEVTLREAEERFRSAFSYAEIGMALVGIDGRWLQVNRSTCEIVGYSEQELLSKTFQDITHPDDLEADLGYVRQLLSGEIRTYQMEKRYFHKRGHEVWVLLSVSLERDIKGNPYYFISQIQDITERKRAEEALRRSESSLAAAQRIAHVGNWEHDVKGDRAWWSDEMYRIFGFAPQSFVPTYRAFLSSVHPDDRGFIRRSVRKALYEARYYGYNIEYRIIRPDDEVRAVHTRYEVIHSETGRPIELIGTLHDITERKALEKRLQHQAFHDPLTDLPNRTSTLVGSRKC